MIKKSRDVLNVIKYINSIAVIGLVFFFSACKIYKPAYYFKEITKDTLINGVVSKDMELIIHPNDLLAISISSLSVEDDLLFNKAALTTGDSKTGFEVNNDGNIYLHKLGKIAVAGLTRKQLKAKLEKDLQPFLKDAVVTVNFANHRVTVLGDGSSLVVEMPDEKISLLEVMAKSSGVTANSQLNNLMVVREVGTAKQVKHLNLQDHSIFTSPWYYLQPNDIVVVKPNEAKLVDDQKKARNQLYFATLLTATTFVLLIVDRIFR